MTKSKISGIYQIKNTQNNKIYIGSSTNFSMRWKKHKYDLSKNKHSNQLLQRAWNKYGKETFEFSIIKLCPPNTDILLFFEQHYLDYYWDNGYNCYNILKIAGSSYNHTWTKEQKLKVSGQNSPSFGKTPWLGKKHSPETKQKQSFSHTGKCKSEQHKKAISAGKSGDKAWQAKLTWEEVREIRKQYQINKISQRQLAKEYNVSVGTIYKIVFNLSWKE